jgi:hypothetical protein
MRTVLGRTPCMKAMPVRRRGVGWEAEAVTLAWLCRWSGEQLTRGVMEWFIACAPPENAVHRRVWVMHWWLADVALLNPPRASVALG